MNGRLFCLALLVAVGSARADDTNAFSRALGERGYVSVDLLSSGAGQLCAPVRIKGQTLYFLVDTGSTFTLIDKAAAEDLELAMNPRRTVELVEMNGGRREHRLTAPVFVYVGVHLLPPQELTVAELRKMTVEVTSNQAPEIRGIIGGTILRKHGAVIDCGNRKLYFTGAIGVLEERPLRPSNGHGHPG